GVGLWPGKSAGARRGRRRRHEFADPDGERYAARYDPRDRRLHGARAGKRPPRRSTRRYLGFWLRAVRDAQRPEAVSWRGRLGPPRISAQNRSGLALASGGHAACRAPPGAAVSEERSEGPVAGDWRCANRAG